MSRNPVPPDAVAKARHAIGAGLSLRAAAELAGVSHETVRKIRKEMAAAFVASPAPTIAAQQPLPFGPDAQPPAIVPPPAWGSDQTPPPPARPEYRAGYHGHTFRSFSAPLGFDGWTLERIRAAIAAHDLGIFLESSLLAIALTRFGPVFAALSQAIAPALALPRHVRSGTRGLSRYLGEQVRSQLAPRAGLTSSPYLPSTLWGAVATDLRTMGFSVLQHAYGEPDEDGVRPVYTRRWPTWAVQYYRYRRTYVAITTDGPVDIVSGDGKFTLVGDTEEPHFDGAVRALALEVMDGSLVKQARASYVDRYGSPKWVGFMPEGTAVRSPEGDAFFEALGTIQGPHGVGALPHGSEFRTVEMSGAQSTVFKDSLDQIWQYCAAILLGSDGTMTRGTGVYSAPIFAGVRRDLVDRMLGAMVTAVNVGHVGPWLQFNYAAGIEAAKARGVWVDPVLEIPLPDPDADARIASLVTRTKALTDQIAAERAAGCVVTQERVEQLAATFEVDAPTLSETAPAPAQEGPASAPEAPEAPEAPVGPAGLAHEAATRRDSDSGATLTEPDRSGDDAAAE